MKRLKYSNDEFIEKIKQIHGNKFFYEKTIYKGCNENVIVTCKIHGDFEIKTQYLLNGGGCPKCAYENVKSCQKSNNFDFIRKSKEKHGNKYDYSQVFYNGNKVKVCIICKIHGKFYMTPNSHLSGQGCPKCGKQSSKYKLSMTLEQFIEKAKTVHGNKYDYSKTEYVNNKTPITIICPKHGEFKQTPSKHINSKHGCPYCKESKLEKEVKLLLQQYKIDFIQEANNFYLPWIGKQRLDFYIPKYNLAIECQGEQHFKSIDFFGGEKHLQYVKKLDKDKKNKCLMNNVQLFEYIGNKQILEEKIKAIIKS